MFGLVPFDRRHKELQNHSEDPFSISNMMESFFNDSIFPSFYCNSSQMKVDIRETDSAYLLDADLPGISKDQVNLEVDDDRLTISVSQDEEKESKDSSFIRKERHRSVMTRSFSLSNINQEEIEANMHDGVLHVKLPKTDKEKSRGRTIDIK